MQQSHLIFAAQKAFASVDTSHPGTYVLGFVNFDIVCLNVKYPNLGLIPVHTFTSSQIRDGLTAHQWISLVHELRTIFQQLKKCQKPS